MKSNAIISADGRHRYVLERNFKDGPSSALRTLGVIMVNPSTADATNDDPTIRRVTGFAQRWGFERVLVGNKFAFRATDIKELAGLKGEDAVGEWNDLYLAGIAHTSEQVVVAWGPLAKLPLRLRERWKQVIRVLDDRKKIPYCIGATAKDGHPRHPLMLKNDEPLVEWKVPWFPNRAAEETQEARNARADREADTAHASGYLASDAH